MFSILNRHLQAINILITVQFGFRKGIAIENGVLHHLIIFLLH